MKLHTHILGYPRIGAQRELKKALEAYWKGNLSAEELERTAAQIRRDNWLVQKNAGVELIPSNDFSYYDQVLDTTCLLGNIPERFRSEQQTGSATAALDLLFRIARGRSVEKAAGAQDGHACGCGKPHAAANTGDSANAATDTTASEMTKWFDTNYHYIVPEFDAQTSFALSGSKIFDEFEEALKLGIRTKPVLLGPVSYLLCGKVRGEDAATLRPLDLLEKLLPVYAQILERLAELGAEWVQLDEPVLSLDLDAGQQQALTTAYTQFGSLHTQGKAPRLLLANYFGPLQGNLQTAIALPVQALHADAVRAREEIPALLETIAKTDKVLSLGVIDGRNIWRTDFAASLELIEQAKSTLGANAAERLWLAPSCSLLHVPLSLKPETGLDAELKSWLAFAEEKLAELAVLATAGGGCAGDTLLPNGGCTASATSADRTGIVRTGTDCTDDAKDSALTLQQALEANHAAINSRRNSARIHRAEVKARVAALTPEDSRRKSPFNERIALQRQKLKLPAFPTTTIGSFPQSKEVRAARARFRKGEWSAELYEAYLEEETLRCIRVQEEIGIDVLVHGEFERTDMVEYFGEFLDGFTFTRNGWVQSYGSRCVKPPVIYGDVARPEPMTVRWSAFAQAQTNRPMKGMLTGPVTILQWSFVRDDQPRSETTRQIALAIRDEVVDLEQAGIPVIQIDEPAIREGLPLRRRDWGAYLAWATESFRISASGVRDETQIHTHMCYSEFNDIIAAIAALDADCISIETARSDMELLQTFEDFNYPNEIGPGVWDIHSPRVPPAAEMAELLRKAARVLPVENLWANPDCGLKTRGWPETLASLRNLVEAAQAVRKEFAATVSAR